MLRRLLAVAVVLVAAAAFPVPAQAAVTLVTCAGQSTQTYDPPLTLSTQMTDIDANVTYSGCLGGPVTAGAAAVTTTAQAGCVLSGSSTVTQQVTWNSGATSTTVGDTIATRTLGQTIVVTRGTVTAGLFAGAQFVQTVVFVNPDPLACLTTGVSTVSGPLTITFTG